MSGSDAIGMVLELLSWVGIGGALVCFMLTVAVRVIDGTWLDTTAVLIPVSDAVEARWMTAERTVHSRLLDEHEHSRHAQKDSATVFYSRRSPDRMRFHRLSEGERILWLLIAIMGALAVLSLIASLVVLLIESA